MSKWGPNQRRWSQPHEATANTCTCERPLLDGGSCVKCGKLLARTLDSLRSRLRPDL